MKARTEAIQQYRKRITNTKNEILTTELEIKNKHNYIKDLKENLEFYEEEYNRLSGNDLQDDMGLTDKDLMI